MDELFKDMTFVPVNTVSLNDAIVDTSMKLGVIMFVSITAVTLSLSTYVQIMTLLQ